MKSTLTLKVTLISATLVVVAGLYFSLPAAQNCQEASNDNPPSCAQANNQSWFSWLKGQSRSTQFHFVDLLELINRVSPAKK